VGSKKIDFIETESGHQRPGSVKGRGGWKMVTNGYSVIGRREKF
jgi:hypothetical protein